MSKGNLFIIGLYIPDNIYLPGDQNPMNPLVKMIGTS